MSKQISREYIKRIGKNSQYTARTTTGGGSGGGGGSVPSLNQLRDVEITNETDGDVIVYNSTDNKWENKDKAPKAEVADKVGTSTVGSTQMPVYISSGTPTKCGNSKADTTLDVNITGEAATVPWTGVHDVIYAGNEFNVCDSTPSSNEFWFNYRGRQGGNLSSRITTYEFGNGQHTHSGVTVKAENFYADGAVTALSDIREKSPVGAIELNLDEIADAPAIRFVWKNRQDDTVQAGTVAQYWQDVLPEVVRKQSEGLLTMDYAVAALVSAITLAREVRTLKEKLEKLEKEHGNNVKLK